MRRSVVAVLLLAAVSSSFAGHRKLPPEQQVTGSSRLVQQILSSPPPADARDALAAALVLDYAHELDAARALRGYVARRALASIAGVEAGPAPAHVYSLGTSDPGGADDERMRADALKLVQPEVVEPNDAAVTPQVHGWVTRHNEGPVWTRSEGEREMNRILAVSFRNAAAQPLARGELYFHLQGLGERYEFSCNFGSVPAHAAAPAFCWTLGDVPPLADVVRALDRRSGGSPIADARMHTAVFTVDGRPFDVTLQSANFENTSGLDDEARAWDLLDATPCTDKGTCVGGFIGSIARSPFMLGFVAGLGAGTLYLVVALGWGEARAGAGWRFTSLIASAVAAACLVALLAWSARFGWIYGVMLGAAVASAFAAASAGFILGLGAAILAGVLARFATARA